MIAALPLFFLGALTFVGQDVTDELLPAYRQADVDRDGKVDLLLSSAIYLQRDGGFSQAGRVEFPETDSPHATDAEKPLPYCDTWNDTLYLCTAEQLFLFYWENGAWKGVLSQPMKWAGSFPESSMARQLRQEQQSQLRVRISGFLHDLNGDGIPEIVLAGQDGLHCYQRSGQGYAETAKLDMLTKMHSIPDFHPPEVLWPAQARSVVFSERAAACDYVIQGNQVTVLDREHIADGNVCYHVRQLSLDPALKPVPGSEVESMTQAMPMHFGAARIDKDGHVVYAGVLREDRASSVISSSVCDYRFTVDGGKTFMGTRSSFFWTRDPFLDFDGDGTLDIGVETTMLLEGGVKEVVTRAMTAREVDGEIRIFLQKPAGTLPKEPSIVFRFARTMEQPLAFGYWPPHFGQFSLRGDFDGDGRRDLLLPETEDKTSVHLFDGKSFNKAAACSVSLTRWAICEVADFDGDGRSDVFFQTYALPGDEPVTLRRLYLTREVKP